MNPHQSIAQSLGISSRQVEATAALLSEGGTVPSIARYYQRTAELWELQAQELPEYIKANWLGIAWIVKVIISPKGLAGVLSFSSWRISASD